MARPTKPEDQLRTATIRVRVTPSEKIRISDNAQNAGLNPSDFLRGFALGTKPARVVPTPDRELLLKVLAELNKNGSNLNQIARAHNRMREDGEAVGITAQQMNNTINAVDALTKQLMEILKK